MKPCLLQNNSLCSESDSQSVVTVGNVIVSISTVAKAKAMTIAMTIATTIAMTTAMTIAIAVLAATATIATVI